MNTDLSILKFFADYIGKRLGITYNDLNYYQLESRLFDIARVLGFASVPALFEAAQRGVSVAMEHVITNYAVNNETFFFRDQELFKAIAHYLIPKLAGPTRRQQPIRVWSAACSFGQEPYSLALLFERATKQWSDLRYEIHASDVSERALDFARQGVYSQMQVARGLSDEDLRLAFVEQASEGSTRLWRVRDEIRQNLSFHRLNLLESFGSMGIFDLILCRNVLIYQPLNNRIQIVAKMVEHLDAEGSFILGAAESLIGVSESLILDGAAPVTLYRKQGL